MNYRNCILDPSQNISWPDNYGCEGNPQKVIICRGNCKGLLVPDLTTPNGEMTKNDVIDNIPVIDRFGDENGFFFSLLGNPWIERSLPYFQNNNKNCKEIFNNDYVKNSNYHKYEILKPFVAFTCTVAPAFGASGGGQQFWTTLSIEQLLSGGFIKRVNNEPYPRYNNFNSSLNLKILKSYQKYLKSI
jgi:hypothetical protein